MYYFHAEGKDNQFLVNPHFIKVSPTSGSYIQAREYEAQGVVMDGTPYSINTDKPIPDITTATLIPYYDWNEDIQAQYDAMRCEEAKEYKIRQLSEACKAAINAGGEVKISDEVTESFTYSIDDQANVSEMATAVTLGADAYPYHANGRECRMYQRPEIITMYSTLSAIKTHHLTYFNQLKAYVQTLTKAEDVYAVVYGQELTGEYLTRYTELMAQAKTEMDKVIANMAKVQDNEATV